MVYWVVSTKADLSQGNLRASPGHTRVISVGSRVLWALFCTN